MPATFTISLPPTKSDPSGTAFDWTPGGPDAGKVCECKRFAYSGGRKPLAALGALVAAGRV